MISFIISVHYFLGMDVVERFRTNTRRVHVWIFLGLSMLLSLLTSVLLVHHILYESPIIFAAGYGGVMVLATSIAVAIPIVDSNVGFRKLVKLFKNLETKYLLFTTTYLWLGIGFYSLYPLNQVIGDFGVFPSVYTGPVAGTLCMCLMFQFLILNYILVGRTDLSKQDLETLNKMIEDDVDEYDPEDYKDREIEDLESYKERMEEEKEDS